MKINHKKGFTLVETLVAITVMLLIIIGPMTVAQKGIQTAYFATEQATAVFLAQEAIEAVRESRDNRALEVYRGKATDNDYSGKTSTWSDSCSSCEEYSGYLFVNSEGQYVDYQGGSTKSQFRRNVDFEEVDSGTAVVTVTVSWNAQVFGGNEKSVELKTWIYDHYRRYE